MNTYSQRKQFTTNAAQQLSADTRAIGRADRELRRQAAARHEADKALEGTITREMLAGNTQVRDSTGWHLILRTNKRTVKVAGAWGSTRLIAIERIRQVKP